MFEDYLREIEKFLEKETIVESPANLYQPIKYITSIGGKRIRPLLCLLSFELFDRDFRDALPQAAAIEMFHNFTLVHDDIMDAAPLRRGMQTVHKKYSTNNAVLSGDAMLIWSYQLLSRGLEGNALRRTLDTFSDTAIRVCEGQQYDMDFEEMPEVEIESYIEMIRCKTAVLLGTAMSLGGIIAGCNTVDERHLWDCGVSMGMAFQVQDDLLDVFGDIAMTGKQKGGDIIQNKQTFLLIKAMELAGPRQRSDLKALYDMSEIAPDEKVRQVKSIYQALEVERHCETAKNRYATEGFAHLASVHVDDPKKESLVQLFTRLLDRRG